MFGKRTAAAATSTLPVILVPRSAHESETEWSLPSAVVDFANHAIHKAMFQREELPPQAMQAFHVDYYIAQVNNGGHSQFVHNSHWHDYVVSDIRNGLAAIGLDEAKELFEDLCEHADRKPGEFIEGMKAGGFGEYPEWFKRLDSQFYAGLNKRLVKATSDWIRSLDCLMVMEDEPYRQTMGDLWKRNPLFEKRKVERDRLAQEELNNDPIYRACQFVGIMATSPVNVSRWLQARGAQGPEGVSGKLVMVETADDRIAQVYLFPTFAAMVPPGCDKPDRPIPIDLVQEWVQKHTGDYLPTSLWS